MRPVKAGVLEPRAQCAPGDAGWWNFARHAEPNSENRLRIAFTDTGRGMSPDQVEHLFEPFPRRRAAPDSVFQLFIKSFAIMVVQSMCVAAWDKAPITVELPVAAKNGDLAPEQS